MAPDPEYTVKKVEVWRVVGPDGQELVDEDDHGEYPRDFNSYEAAFRDAVKHMQCCIPYGPRTKKDQEIADSFAGMAKLVNQYYGRMFEQTLMKPMPFANSQTIQFRRA